MPSSHGLCGSYSLSSVADACRWLLLLLSPLLSGSSGSLLVWRLGAVQGIGPVGFLAGGVQHG
jgi:hypothetical protein